MNADGHEIAILLSEIFPEVLNRNYAGFGASQTHDLNHVANKASVQLRENGPINTN
jgi:hypothetical protein